MNSKSFQKILGAFLGTILFLFLGFWLVWFAETHFYFQQEAVLFTLFIIPIILYLVLSGKLQEFSAGGITAKLKDTAQEPIFNKDEMNTDLIDVDPTTNFPKGTPQQLEEYLLSSRFQATSDYLVLTIKLGKGYNANVLLMYLKAMSRNPNFKFLVILDGIRQYSNEVFAYTPVWQGIQILEFEEGINENAFIDAIHGSEKAKLLDYYHFTDITLVTTDTKLRALEKMVALKMDALIVTDERHVLKGVVERVQLLNKLILALPK
jgi:hypothetical protein